MFLLPVGAGIIVLVLTAFGKIWNPLPYIALTAAFLFATLWIMHKLYRKGSGRDQL